MKKIIFTGDMLRPSENGSGSNQKVNIDWLYHLLSGPIKASLDIDISVLNWEKGSFDSKKFYKLNGHNSLPNDWIELYKAKDYSKESLKYFGSFFQDSLVIGFELPDIFMHMLESLGITYIDIINHPIRYMDDIFFGIKTNNVKIFKRLKEYAINEQSYHLFASYHRATVSRMKKLSIPEGSALFTGQVGVDKSLIADDQLLTLLDFKSQFEEITKKHAKVFYKKHPYAEKNTQIEEFVNQFNNIEFIDENFYYLLGQKNISHVYSISSSTVYEAKMWGKNASYFYKSPFKFWESSSPDDSELDYISVYNEFLTPMFWKDLLEDIFLVKPNIDKILVPPAKTSRLRNSLQYYWGYNFLDTDILVNNSDLHKDFSTFKKEYVTLVENLSNTKKTTTYSSSISEIMSEIQGEVRQKRNELESRNSNNDVKCDDQKRPVNFKKDYQLSDFYQYKSIQFVDNAIKSILKREPTQAELQFYTFALRNREMKKLEILFNLLQTQEAKQEKIQIKGLKPKLFIARLISLWKIFF